MTQWFGKSWGAPCCEPKDHAATPAWVQCHRCKEVIMPDDQGLITPLATAPGNALAPTMLAEHIDCFLWHINPHGPECPHCRGLEIDEHPRTCTMWAGGLCNCQPMPAGKHP